VAGLLESLHAELDIGLKLAGLSIVLYHLVVDSDGGRYSSGNSGGGRLGRMCVIGSEGARCVKDDLHSKSNSKIMGEQDVLVV
jgi:hypothetical protein